MINTIRNHQVGCAEKIVVISQLVKGALRHRFGWSFTLYDEERPGIPVVYCDVYSEALSLELESMLYAYETRGRAPLVNQKLDEQLPNALLWRKLNIPVSNAIVDMRAVFALSRAQ